MSSIEWTEVTWNPVTGCDRISAGCDHCYALTLAKRLKAMGARKYQIDGDPRTSGPGFGVTVHENVMTEPLRWRTPRKVFVNSMSDIAHARIPRWAQAQIWAAMALTPRHQFQILTKRPNRLANLLLDRAFYDLVNEAIADIMDRLNGSLPVEGIETAREWIHIRERLRGEIPAPLPNVWLGTSIESDEYCWRADELLRTPASIRFLSCEPLLGPLPRLDLTGIDWVIVGGESGPGFRPIDLDWVRDLRERRGRTALFFKQVGGRTPKAGGRLLDGRTWDEYPALTEAVSRSG
jgi:protein gp37